MTRARRNFVLFAVAVAGAGWLGVAADLAGGAELANDAAFSDSGGTPGMLVFILGPVVTAVVLFFASRDGAGPLGLTLRFPHRTRWFTAALLLYPVITAVSVGAGLAVGAVTFSWTGSEPLVAAFLTVFAVQVIKNPIEEFIFRGYGTRTAMALSLPSRLAPHLLVGVVWSAWHLPLYLMWTSAADMRLVTSLSWPLFLVLMFAGLTAAAVLYGEVRVRTGSIWPGVVLHSMTNAIATPLVVNGHLGFTGHADALFSPIASSVVVMVLFGALGLLLVSGRRPDQAPAPRPERDPAVVLTTLHEAHGEFPG
ncbi:type II CAAX prenyl endopeptidase Rce1 family protein [Dactylosporangium cerinum]|uniref:Type II CAAX prenyl endopeptidase Rce1 family protein n=1 Tax=Dactylosporangium cerinum TaxID=1434730 RepID=A0ABV9W8F6_9ACTN